MPNIGPVFVQATDLVHMRLTQVALMDSTAVVHRATKVSDGQGGYTETWAALAQPEIELDESTHVVPARIGVPTQSERRTHDKVVTETSAVITVPYGVDVALSDRIVTGGKTYQVTARMSGGQWETAVRVMANLIE